LIEHAHVCGEPPDDPLLLFEVLYAFWVANFVAFNGRACRDLSAEFLSLAQKQKTIMPLVIGHRLMGTSLLFTGDCFRGKENLDRALVLYDAAEQRPLATRFGQDIRVVILSQRPQALWLLGFPDAALADIELAVKEARDINQAATLMYALFNTTIGYMHRRDYEAAKAQLDELIALADDKGALFWRAQGITEMGCIFAFPDGTSQVGPECSRSRTPRMQRRIGQPQHRSNPRLREPRTRSRLRKCPRQFRLQAVGQGLRVMRIHAAEHERISPGGRPSLVLC
jgi:tetratricopeptide (TPR) repeat protein